MGKNGHGEEVAEEAAVVVGGSIVTEGEGGGSTDDPSLCLSPPCSLLAASDLARSAAKSASLRALRAFSSAIAAKRESWDDPVSLIVGRLEDKLSRIRAKLYSEMMELLREAV